MDTATTRCGRCGAVVSAGRSFCGNCGESLAGSEGPLMTGNRWARRVGDFATRIEPGDVTGFFKKGLIVEEGTKAIFFVNGAYSGVLEAGKYDMGGVVHKIKNLFDAQHVNAILVDAGDVGLSFKFQDIQTSDPLRINMDCQVIVQIDNPTKFYENMLKRRNSYPRVELEQAINNELRNAVQQFIGKYSAEQLSADYQLRADLENSIGEYMRTSFEQMGLSFTQIRALNFYHERLNAVTNKKEEYWLYKKELEAQLVGQGDVMGIERKLLDQQTGKMLSEVRVLEERVQVWDRMRKAMASDKMNEIRNENAFEKFLYDIDKGKILRAEDRKELLRMFKEKEEDHNKARSYLIQKANLEMDLEMERLRLMGKLSLGKDVQKEQMDMELNQLEHELNKRRLMLRQKQDEEWAAFRQKALMEEELRRKKEEEQKAQDERDRKQALEGLDLLDKTKEVKGKEADRDSARKLKEDEAAHKQEMERLTTLSTLSIEALISASDKDKAQMLSELKKTELLKDFSEERILALAADRSGEVAKAFQEKYRRLSADEQKLMHERMLAEKDKATADIKEMVNIMHDMFNKAVETQRDTSVGTARGSNIIIPGTGPGQGTTVIGPQGQTSGAQKVMVCPNCHLETEVGKKFCENCGHKFFAS
jgi:regulator of protease activity HflC (stomatin/prohibitin superfamily)